MTGTTGWRRATVSDLRTAIENSPFIGDYVAASDGILRYTVQTPTVLIGGIPATPIYSVLSPQFVSEYQIGVTPAANTPRGALCPCKIQIGGVTTTNPVTLAVAP